MATPRFFAALVDYQKKLNEAVELLQFEKHPDIPGKAYGDTQVNPINFPLNAEQNKTVERLFVAQEGFYQSYQGLIATSKSYKAKVDGIASGYEPSKMGALLGKGRQDAKKSNLSKIADNAKALDVDVRLSGSLTTPGYVLENVKRAQGYLSEISHAMEDENVKKGNGAKVNNQSVSSTYEQLYTAGEDAGLNQKIASTGAAALNFHLLTKVIRAGGLLDQIESKNQEALDTVASEQVSNVQLRKVLVQENTRNLNKSELFKGGNPNFPGFFTGSKPSKEDLGDGVFTEKEANANDLDQFDKPLLDATRTYLAGRQKELTSLCDKQEGMKLSLVALVAQFTPEDHVKHGEEIGTIIKEMDKLAERAKNAGPEALNKQDKSFDNIQAGMDTLGKRVHTLQTQVGMESSIHQHKVEPSPASASSYSSPGSSSSSSGSSTEPGGSGHRRR